MAEQSQAPHQEIDLGQVYKKLRQSAGRANNKFFDLILFIKRNIIVVALLLIAGAVLGYFLDKSSHVYRHKVIVSPNFGSVDYLYEEVEHINTKIRENDTVYLKNDLKLAHPQLLGAVEVEPVVDIYKFINEGEPDENERKLQLFRLMAEKGDVDKLIEDKATSKNYKNHLLILTTGKPVKREDIVDPILATLNSNPFLVKMQQEHVNNLRLKTAANDTIIKQIDAILNDFSRKSGRGTGNSNLMYYNDNTQLNELIKLKDKLVEEQGQNRIDQINFTSIIKDNGVIMNVRDYKATTGKMKFILPFLFLFLFLIAAAFRAYYKSQMAKRSALPA